MSVIWRKPVLTYAGSVVSLTASVNSVNWGVKSPTTCGSLSAMLMRFPCVLVRRVDFLALTFYHLPCLDTWLFCGATFVTNLEMNRSFSCFNTFVLSLTSIRFSECSLPIISEIRLTVSVTCMQSQRAFIEFGIPCCVGLHLYGALSVLDNVCVHRQPTLGSARPCARHSTRTALLHWLTPRRDSGDDDEQRKQTRNNPWS